MTKVGNMHKLPFSPSVPFPWFSRVLMAVVPIPVSKSQATGSDRSLVKQRGSGVGLPATWLQSTMRSPLSTTPGPASCIIELETRKAGTEFQSPYSRARAEPRAVAIQPRTCQESLHRVHHSAWESQERRHQQQETARDMGTPH